MKFQIKCHAVISTMITMTIALFFACTVQPASQNSSPESPKVDEIISDSVINDSVEATVQAEMAIQATVQAFISATSTAQEPVDCEADDPDEYGNIVHWCDDGSHWWIDSVTGYRYEMDAEGNGVSDDPAGYPIPELFSKGNNGDTPLHNAALGDALEVARLLIDRGADMEANVNYDSTALGIAIQSNSLDVASLLIEFGANTEGRDLSWMN